MKLIEVLSLISSHEIQICTTCKGTGKVVDDSWGSGFSDKVQCSTCEGQGRTKQIIAQAKLQVPFNFTVI